MSKLTSPTIELSEKDIIGKGSDRVCYRNPLNQKQCIKIIIPSRKGAVKRAIRELKEHKRLVRNEVDLSSISVYSGTVSTSLGKGYLYELVLDYDGATSKTLDHYYTGELQGTFQKKQIFQLLHDFYNICYENCYILSELHEMNLVIQKNSQLDKSKVRVIDGMGNADFIKCCNWLPFLSRKKINRRFKTLARRMDIEFSEICR